MCATALIAGIVSGCRTTELGRLGKEPKSIVHYDGAKALHMAADHRRAVMEFERFLSRNSKSSLAPAARYYLARSYQVMNDFGPARRNLQELLDNYDTGIWVDLARWELEKIDVLKIVRPAGTAQK